MNLMIIPQDLESTHYMGFIDVKELPDDLQAKVEAEDGVTMVEGDYTVRWVTDFDGTFAEVTLGKVSLWTTDGRRFTVPYSEVNWKDILEWLESRVDKYHQAEDYSI